MLIRCRKVGKAGVVPEGSLEKEKCDQLREIGKTRVVPQLEGEKCDQLREIGKAGVVPGGRKIRPTQGDKKSRSCIWREKI